MPNIGHRFRYIAFDVETPNHRNHRISSIGVAVIENRRIVRKFYTLINPEQEFDTFNIKLTGITPTMVKDAPSFREAWATLAPLFASGILIAHNAAFDLNVLSRCLNDYRVEYPKYALYACTVKMGKKCYPELHNHGLNTLCEHLHIDLSHHRADSDSLACGNLLLQYMDCGLDIKENIRTYDLVQGKTVRKFPPGW